MTGNELVSFIVPVYNGEKYIERCIKSICRQTYSNIEIIVVDDGSTDLTENLMKQMAMSDDRIRIFSKKNGGASSARNYGLNRIRGEYVFFVDSDDWIDSGMVEYNMSLISKNNVEMVINDFYYNELEYKDTFAQIEGEVLLDKLRETLIVSDKLNSQCLSMYATKIIRENNILFPEDIKCGEDNIFNLYYVDCIKRAYYTKRAYYHYEVHKDSGCRKLHHDQIEMYEKQLEIKMVYLEKWGGLQEKIFGAWAQLIGTYLSAFTLMAEKKYKLSSFIKWLNKVYKTKQFEMLKQNKIFYRSIPKTYRILLWLLVHKRTTMNYLYCKCVNSILG